MKELAEIKFGFSDAENYRRRENKELFAKIFLRTSAIEKILAPSTFFLIGEKGTGKTAYAVHLSSSPPENTRAIHKFIRETDYQKFISLREENQLKLSEFTDIWKVIIYLLLADAISESIGTRDVLSQYPKFQALRAAIDEYYSNAFSPEIPIALQLIENSQIAASVLAKHTPLSGSASYQRGETSTSNLQTFQVNLLAIERMMKEALSSVKLRDNIMLFIDGIDIRPPSIPYAQYLDCVKGLANAIWSVNNDFFPSIRDSKGRMRAIALLRPDIFNSLGLQNRNTKLRDNSAILNWNVIYATHRVSELFKMADRLFSAQQVHKCLDGACWDHYFPFNANNARVDTDKFTSFVTLLRYSWHRPRDIFSMLDILHENLKDELASSPRVFSLSDLVTANFRRKIGNYLLGEIRDSLSFYYNDEEFEYFLKFFEFLNGKTKFDYQTYVTAYNLFHDFLSKQNDSLSLKNKSAEEFLQILFEQNIISYFEDADDELFVRWCFLERTSSNLAPKVKIGLRYEFHYGLANALNIGKELKTPRRNIRTNITKPSPKEDVVPPSMHSIEVLQAQQPPPKQRKKRRRRRSKNATIRIPSPK